MSHTVSATIPSHSSPGSVRGSLPWKTKLHKLLAEPLSTGYSCSQISVTWDPSMGYSLVQCGSFIMSEVLPANLLQCRLLFMGTQGLPGTFSSAGFPRGHSLSGTHTHTHLVPLCVPSWTAGGCLLHWDCHGLASNVTVD